ncbi:MAG: aldehyde dehydrogenase family protein [Planctomycetaceae bacterium]|nr:aldehyde dehydrogenase family protein [Planctomycetaceae bacterium]
MQSIRDLDPATGEVLAEVPFTSPEALADAVARARAAAPGWSDVPIETRCELLAASAERLLDRAEELADLIVREMGKPRAEALGEVRGRARGLREELDEIRRALQPEHLHPKSGEALLLREPHGVVAAITPWNFPVGMPLDLLVPALAAGNTVLFKPSEHVPLVGAALAEILGATLPDGVLQLIQGGGSVGAALVASDVDMIAFVGSRTTGVAILTAAAAGLKRVVLELGGKDPLIVFEDADLDSAADCAVRHSLRNAGQVCCAVERVYVAESVAAEFERKVLALARTWESGSGFDPKAKLGPLVSAEQREKVRVLVDDAVAQGARLVLGGRPTEGPGYFFEPTVLADVPEGARLVREETFGPVVSLATFSGDEDEAVRLANDTVYGLGANVYTGDKERGLRVAKRIKSGQVGVNRYLVAAPGAPWVGQRQSGYGYLGGVDGHRQFTVPKTVGIA